MKIWVHLNGIQQGPYEFEDLQRLPINEETPVWYEGLPGWLPAGQAPATAPLFANNEQAYIETPQQQAQAQYVAPQAAAAEVSEAPKTFLVWSVVLTILCCSPISILAIITGIITSTRFKSGDYKGAQSMSTITEWLVILSITFGCMSMPLMMLTI